MTKMLSASGGLRALTRGSAAGPRWGIFPQTPVIGSCSALAMVPPNQAHRRTQADSCAAAVVAGVRADGPARILQYTRVGRRREAGAFRGQKNETGVPT